MALSNNGQKGIRKQALDSANLHRFLKGENFEFLGSPSDIYNGNFNELPSSVFNILQLVNNEAESVTGISAFNTGISGNSLGNTATGIRGAINSASTRRLNIVRNISENLVKPLLRKWIAYNAVYLDKESQVRITEDQYVVINKDDLNMQLDIDLSISTSDDNQAKASELAFILQTMGNSQDPEISKMIMIEIARLYKMPQLVKELQEYKPQPDPYIEAKKQLDLKLLEAEVMEKLGKAKDNSQRSELTKNKAVKEQAQTENILANVRKTNLDWLHKYNGIEYKQDLEKEKLKENYKINLEMLKAMNNNKKNNV